MCNLTLICNKTINLKLLLNILAFISLYFHNNFVWHVYITWLGMLVICRLVHMSLQITWIWIKENYHLPAFLCRLVFPSLFFCVNVHKGSEHKIHHPHLIEFCTYVEWAQKKLHPKYPCLYIQQNDTLFDVQSDK